MKFPGESPKRSLYDLRFGLVANYRRRVEAVLNLRLPHPTRPAGWIFLGNQQTDYSLSLAYEVPPGYSIRDVEKQIDALVAACGADVELENYAGRIAVTLYLEDLPEVIPFHPDSIEYGPSLFLGYNRERQPVYFHFENPHLLVAGETGFGKTSFILLLLWQLVRRSPENCEIALVDLKGTSYLQWVHFPHIMGLYTEMQEAEEILRKSVEHLIGIKREAKQAGKLIPPKKKRFIFIDEAAQLAPSEQATKGDKVIADQIESHISYLARLGREYGVHIIYATQYPTAQVVNSQIKMNAGARVCFHVPAQVNSMVVLDEPGAEQLTVKGRAIFKAAGRKEIIQVPFATKDQWEEWLRDGAATDVSSSPQSDARYEYRPTRPLPPE